MAVTHAAITMLLISERPNVLFVVSKAYRKFESVTFR